MKISVIVPTYKPQDYLWECLDSLVGQTFSREDFEIILVLNGCTEPYKTSIEEYVAKKMNSMNVNFIHTEKGGVSNARNLGLDKAIGEYITFIDDDDFVSPDYLKELYSKAASDTISISYPYAFNDGDCKQIHYSITDAYDLLNVYGKQRYLNARKFFSGPCMKLIPNSFISDRRFDKRFMNGEDSLFIFLISDKFKYVNFTSHKAVYYRRYRQGSAVTGKRSKKSIILNGMRLLMVTSQIWICNPFKYNFSFYITRCLGYMKGIVMYCKGKL